MMRRSPHAEFGFGVLPLPRACHPARGVCHLRGDVSVELRVDDPRIERAVVAWRDGLPGGLGCGSPDESRPASPDRQRRARVLVAVDSADAPHQNGYRLTIRPDSVTLVGGSPEGCFYGLQTLARLPTQSRRAHGPSQPGPREIPCCTIIDWPDFATRGLLHDVTRGKVPTLDTLKTLVGRLALLKINQLQLYIEHAFVFSFDPDVCPPDDGLTPDEVRALDRYCRDRFIDLVPAVATFGHMGRILSMPKYRRLAEVETTKSWTQMSFPERMHGLTLDCMNPEAHRLVESLWSDVLDAFTSPVVNICGDEPWDLGEGKNKKRFATCGKGEPYVDHIRRTHAICAARGRRTQFFSDVVRNQTHLMDRLPPDATVLHWGYDEHADYDATARFIEAGFETFVCPATAGFKRILNAIGLAERNIAAFAAAGKRYGATGLLNTDWGDHGHFNALACSWHGIALGAALAWRVDHPTGAPFDERLAQLAWGVDDVAGFSRLRAASRSADTCETWRLLWTPLREVSRDKTLPALERVKSMRDASREAARWLASRNAVDDAARRDADELALACRFNALLAEKLAFAHQLRTEPEGFRRARSARRAWVDEMRAAAGAYADGWVLRNKPSGLRDVLGALSAAAEDIGSGADHLDPATGIGTATDGEGPRVRST